MALSLTLKPFSYFMTLYCSLTIAGFLLDECHNTQHNNWDAYFAIDIPAGEVMRGVTSAHDNGKE